MDFALRIDNEVLAAVIDHAARTRPLECCGLLLGRRAGHESMVTEARAVVNVSQGDRSRRYRIEPGALLQAFLAERRGGPEVVGFYHSHPASSCGPSRSDVLEGWSDFAYLIVGSVTGARASVRAWMPSGRERWRELDITAPERVA